MIYQWLAPIEDERKGENEVRSIGRIEKQSYSKSIHEINEWPMIISVQSSYHFGTQHRHTSADVIENRESLWQSVFGFFGFEAIVQVDDVSLLTPTRQVVHQLITLYVCFLLLLTNLCVLHAFLSNEYIYKNRAFG